MFTWIILGVFFAIIIVLIIVATIGARKDKVEKMIETDKRGKEVNEAESARVILFTSLNKIITNLEKELEDFQPSVGTRTLGEINTEVSKSLKGITHSKELKDLYKFEDYKIEFKPIIDELNKVKPSTWSKDATFATNLVKVKFNAISKKKENSSIISEGEKREWN